VKTRDKNKKEMLNAVSGFYEVEKTSFTELPGVIAAFSDLSMINKEIELNEKLIQEGTKGKVVSKDNSREQLITTALVFAGAIYGYAAGKDDLELMTFADLNSSTFNAMRDAEVPLRSEQFLDKADELGAALIPFGVSEESRTTARAGLNDYLQKYGSVNTGKGGKKSAGETNDMLFTKMDKKLKVLDKLMFGFKDKNPELFSRYNAARIIYDKRGSHSGGTDDTPPPPEPPK
jgi:hypothetical protein